MSNYELIKHAILNKKSMSFTYKGQARKASPHIIGSKNGVLKVLFYQYAGGSNSGLKNNPADHWRCLFIDDIQSLEINTDSFQTNTEHQHPQTCIDEIHVEWKLGIGG